MRINKMIIIEKIPWSFTKFSQLILKGNVWRSVWRICMWILGLKGLITAYYAIYLLGINSADKNIFLWIVAQAIKNRGTFSVSWKMFNHAANIKISEISVVLRRPCKIESISVIIKPAIFRVILGKRYKGW